ncbi:hypothetical protein [Paenibacillus alkalitolerans]|uniref:hypothetical protein n=1 Tax=Paenibacillus alkalitolerans TaxID=2799335 RepID=UPI0018F5312B|nr:hypothetical protein [Paenibacillus alkalitolerans]
MKENSKHIDASQGEAGRRLRAASYESRAEFTLEPSPEGGPLIAAGSRANRSGARYAPFECAVGMEHACRE